MAKPTVGAPIPLKPTTAFRISGASNRPAMKASRKRQSSASFGGKSPPTMPLIPPMRPLKNISSTTENPIRAPPIAADRNGCMNTPPSAWLAYFESGFGADGNTLFELGATSELSFPGDSRTQFTPPTIAHRNEAAKSADLPARQATKLNGRSTRMLGLDVPAMLPGSCRRGDQIKWLFAAGA
jgi:hypothetical protein